MRRLCVLAEWIGRADGAREGVAAARLGTLLALAVGVLLVVPGVASAIRPGANGRVVMVSGDHWVIWTGGGAPLVDLRPGVSGVSPDWSPDGRRILFRGVVAGEGSTSEFDLWTVRPDGSDPRRLTETPSVIEFTPVFSPDGTRIAFGTSPVQLRSDPFVVPGGIWVMGSDGSDLRRLTAASNSPASQLFDVDPEWSPDGTWIAFTRQAPRIGSVATILTVRADGTDLRRVVDHGRQPSWSPDGRRIAYTVPWLGSAYGDIWTMDLATGGDRRQLFTDPSRQASAPAWSPDGNLIAFEAMGTHVMSASDGTGRVQLHASAGQPAWERLNRSPTASFRYAPDAPQSGDHVSLVSTSSDPDGPLSSQSWDLDGDGRFGDAEGPSAGVQLAPGVSRLGISLRVRDDEGGESVESTTISVGNHQPTAVTTQPAAPAAPAAPAGASAGVVRRSMVARVSISPMRLSAVLRRGLRLRVRVREPAALVVTARLSKAQARRLGVRRLVAAGRATARNAETVGLTVRFDTRARRRLASMRTVRLWLRIEAKSPAALHEQTTRTVRLRR